jgi:hypothetical protein
VPARDNALDLRLLQHDLRHENGIRIPCLSPWQGARILAVPLEKCDFHCDERRRGGGLRQGPNSFSRAGDRRDPES